jgi:hypothetical protein
MESGIDCRELDPFAVVAVSIASTRPIGFEKPAEWNVNVACHFPPPTFVNGTPDEVAGPNESEVTFVVVIAKIVTDCPSKTTVGRASIKKICGGWPASA